MSHWRIGVVLGLAAVMGVIGCSPRPSVVRFQAAEPAGARIPNISQGLTVSGGRLVFLSGHVPLDANGQVVGQGLDPQAELEAQLVQVFENLRATLRAADADFSDVAKFNFYIRDYTEADLPMIRGVRDRYIDMTRPPPASTLIGVAALYRPEVRVEVDAIAVLE